MDSKEVLATIALRQILPAVQEAFKIQASTTVTVEATNAIVPKTIDGIAVAASLSMTSSAYEGAISILFPEKTLLGIVNQMFGENDEHLKDENADAAGELLNIVYGTARKNINDLGHDFFPAIPAVVRGDSIRLMYGGTPFIVRSLLSCEFGPFVLDVSLKGK